MESSVCASCGEPSMRFCVSFDVMMTIEVMLRCWRQPSGGCVSSTSTDTTLSARQSPSTGQSRRITGTAPSRRSRNRPQRTTFRRSPSVLIRCETTMPHGGTGSGQRTSRRCPFPTKDSTPSRREPPYRSWSISGSQPPAMRCPHGARNWRIREQRFVTTAVSWQAQVLEGVPLKTSPSAWRCAGIRPAVLASGFRLFNPTRSTGGSGLGETPAGRPSPRLH